MGARTVGTRTVAARERTVRAMAARALAATGMLLALALQAGCGSSGSVSADPASVVPASAPLYASFAIKPAGGSNGAPEVAAKKLTRLPEPYGSLAQALLSQGSSAKLEYKRDIAPWVGERGSLFATSVNVEALARGTGSLQSLLQGGLAGLPSALGAGALGAGGSQGAIVLQTSDAGGARSFLSKRASEQHARASSYRGMAYELAPNGVAEGIVKDFAVIGSESGFKGVVDTSLGGASEAGAPGYVKPPAGAIASVYAKPQTLHGAGGGGSTSGGAAGAQTGMAKTSGSAQATGLLGQLFAGAQSLWLTATATSNSVTLQGEVHSAASAAPLFGSEGAKALGEMPGSSWLAAGVADTGANLKRSLALLQGVASLGTATVFSSFGGPAIEKLFAALDSPKAELQRDFASWAGPGGMFISGSGLFNLQAALVIDSKEPNASRAAVGKLGAIMRQAGATVAPASIAGTDAAESVRLPGFPAVIFVADGAGKFVLGLGQQSVQGALQPSATLSTSPAYSTAASTLGAGIEPSLIVEFPALLAFLEGVGLTQSQGLSSIVPYLKSLGTLTAGSSAQGGVERFKVVLGLS